MATVDPTLDLGRESRGLRVVEAYNRIKDSVVRTEIEDISNLFSGSNAKVFAKLENLQETGSFKLRGATNRILCLTDDERVKGVTTASNGNHGLGIASAAKQAGVSAEVFVSMPVGPEKTTRIEGYGTRIRRVGAGPLDAELAAREHASESGRIFISPYNNWDVLAGQGTVAVELLEQIPDLDAVFVTVGGGGLIGGIGSYLKYASPRTEVVGCWPEGSRVLYESLKAGHILSMEEKDTLSESTTGGVEEGSITFEVARSVVDSMVLVTEEEILNAMRLAYREKNWIIEGAAAVALAAFIKTVENYAGKTVAIVICGGNLSARARKAI
ncbi:threonine/serine dehydratase [Terriglobus saanensis]|uniref:Pyridoxal-5'-phosphate-dependent protein beta subunit n=1 Tax=Terriglobus saanensis (strain ATCC BAA-1853 / DSM 23119 / SP1PR4) TaxID=401053 RepID=E8V3F4_TERSS|nr:threonine/serine dehydratase [Terriglobus saanensis]ADV83567.1 Pyridoxal-5'-phosphate-dependent protein beta subunit [Terriglobus saanensis SP1PR4]